jgi:hypothetical protein
MISTKEDVAKIFGSDCDRRCDYDENWQINFEYFGSITKEETVDDKRIKYVPRKDLIGTIYSFTLIPKQNIPFGKISFPTKFRQSSGFSVGDSMGEDGRLTSAVGTSYKTYFDRYGLEYTVYRSGYTVGKAEKETRREGDLMLIEYKIPAKIEKTTFVEEP